MSKIAEHLKASEMGYWEHLGFNLKASFWFFVCCIVTVFHGLMPSLLGLFVPRIVSRLFYEGVEWHPSDKYQAMKQEERERARVRLDLKKKARAKKKTS